MDQSLSSDGSESEAMVETGVDINEFVAAMPNGLKITAGYYTPSRDEEQVRALGEKIILYI